MSEPAPNAFIGWKERPADADLARALGGAKPLWDGLIADLADRHGVAVQEWQSYSLKAGWALRLKRAKRTILWMAPCEGSFRVSFILGEKAVLAARQSGLSARALRGADPRHATAYRSSVSNSGAAAASGFGSSAVEIASTRILSLSGSVIDCAPAGTSIG